ncbi:tRNA (guanosine(37)-N1)-methyltransferase TrmD [Patescibacteria group bacterium]|nr:tRNA (guanosine(37)-N1)-methyltransferase TrmD [Patescibacteria group bacterium]
MSIYRPIGAFIFLSIVMQIHYISIFPSIFDSFLETSLIKKAIEKKVLKFHTINPRDFAPGRHQQVDDTIYGGGPGLLMKAQTAVDAVEHIIKKYRLKGKKFKILYMSPSKETFTQKTAHALSKIDHLIFVCARYEGIDYRFVQYMKKKYKSKFKQISIGQFVTLGGELPAMTMTEAITRLVPGVIKEADSRKDESYNVKKEMKNIEYPQYTKPDEVYGLKVPEVLLN